MQHTCTGLVLHCIDFRFRNSLADFLAKRFAEQDYDLVSVAGGVKGLITEGEDSAFLIKQFDTSRRLHDPKVVVLVQHEDCGAYEGSESFGGFNLELDFQAEELRKAAALVKERFPEATVETYLIRLSGEVIPIKEGAPVLQNQS